ncbi:MAG: hypothetical protein KR126chlam1_00381 [Chlamydiae bacterium]|nr:hypothetical protein [Chlamydiota bacterium]
MGLGRGKEEISVMEAMDILSNMSEVDLKAPIDVELEEEYTTEINWRDPRQALRNEPILKESFRVLHRYLQNIVRTDRTLLEDPQVQKGIQAIMLLAVEATQKMDKYAALYPDKYKPVSHLKEYQDLQKYYLQQILHQMAGPKESPEEWEESLVDREEELELQKRGLKDLEAVRKDQNYELFFIKSDNDATYFSRNLLRHIRLLGNFDELMSLAEGEDPLLRIRELVDRELHEGAKEVLRLSAPYMDIFYKEGMKLKERPYIESLNKSIMALRMAGNSKNLIENQSFKSCLEYYRDFHLFLRDAMQSPGYQKRMAGEGSDPFSHALLNLTHALCGLFFLRIEPRKETLSLIHKMIEKGEEMRRPYEKTEPKEKSLKIWADLRDADLDIRYLLRHYPNGPLMRTLDAFRDEEEFEGYDPLTHENFPSQLLTLKSGELHITLLRLPSPIKQLYISKSEVVEEFSGFLRYYEHELKPDRHLLVNLQDRTSWEEYARCLCLEEFSRDAEFHNAITLLGLSHGTDFYLQSSEYQTSAGAPIFMEQFEQQLLAGLECGYHIPEILQKDLKDFVKKGLKVIHEAFFEGKNTLTIHERRVFIDLFYLLLTLKAIELSSCDSVSFTCKDGVDNGAAASALFFGFIRLLSDPSPLNKEDKERILWMLYSPALTIRERAIQKGPFIRAIRALEIIHAQCLKDHKGVVKKVSSLYKKLKFPFEIQFD